LLKPLTTLARRRRMSRAALFSLLKRLSQCIGLASLILVMNYGEMLGGGRDVRLHVPLRLTRIVVAQVADILVLGVVLFAVLAPLRRTRFYPWVRLLLAVGIPPYLLFRTYTLFPVTWMKGLIPVIAVFWAAFLLLLMMVFPLWYRRVLRFGDALGIFFAVFAFSSILQLLYLAAWKPAPQQTVAAWARAPEPPRQHPLLVWVIFDELSYDQVFEHRARDVNFAAFDALRGISTTFTDVQPVGIKTVKIIPSLLSGHPVDDFKFTFRNKFLVHYSGVHGWHPLDGEDTVFGDARTEGWRTAAVGWYNPYCPIYGDAIDNCYWTNWDKIDGPMAQRKTFKRNLLAPLEEMVREVKSSSEADRANCSYEVHERLITHLDIEKHAFDLLQTDQADFIFLHFSIPHSPNVWSRIDDNYTPTCDSSYIDNLVLVDKELGRILKTLQGSPRWNQTSLIVEGDHSWRVHLWDWLPAWTDEDDHASRGVFDTRPALLIHLAGQQKPVTNATPWPLVDVHDVVDHILRNEPVKY
jgi:hypothetical protein